MRNTTRMTGALVLCLAVIVTGVVNAQDWSQWRGGNRDGIVSGFVPPPAPPAALDKGFSVEVGTGDATPALVGDKLYTFTRQGDEEVVQCLSAADGSQVWEYRYAAAAVTGPGGSHPGPRGTPAVAEGKVVTLGAAGVVSCVDAESGALAWQQDPFPEQVPAFFTSMSPMIVDGMAIAHVGGQGTGALMAFDLATGDTTWQLDGEPATYSSPTLMTVGGTQQIVTMSEAKVIGVSIADGSLLWEIPYAPVGRSSNCTTPVIDGDVVIFTASERGTHAARIAKEGDAFTPTEVWSNAEVACRFSTPVLVGGMLYCYTEKDAVVCMDAGTWQVQWTSTEPLGRMGFASVLSVDDVIVVLSPTSELVAFEASTMGYLPVVTYTVSETPIYAHPIVAGTRVIVKDETTVTEWKM